MNHMVPRTLLVALLCLGAGAGHAQDRSAGKAAALSLLVPGLGHRYLEGGRWDRPGAAFVLAEAGLWLGLGSALWQHGQTVQSYRTLAAGRAGALVEGKDRRFFVNLGAYSSSDAFVEDHLLRRRWDQLSYVSDPAFQWRWSSEEDRQTYMHLRRQADTWSRRRTVFISTLAINRVLAALTTLLAARREEATPLVSLGLVAGSRWPDVHLTLKL